MSSEIYAFAWPRRWVTVISRRLSTTVVIQETADRWRGARALSRVHLNVSPGSLGRVARLRRCYPQELDLCPTT